MPPPNRSQPFITKTNGFSMGTAPKSIVTENGSASPRSCGSRNCTGDTICPSVFASAAVTSSPSLRVACFSAATGRSVHSSCGGNGLTERSLLVGQTSVPAGWSTATSLASSR